MTCSAGARTLRSTRKATSACFPTDPLNWCERKTSRWGTSFASTPTNASRLISSCCVHTMLVDRLSFAPIN